MPKTPEFSILFGLALAWQKRINNDIRVGLSPDLM
jgi:hypothetical protein